MSKVILIVEDNPTLRMITQKSLRHLGYECIAVGSGEEAVAYDPAHIALIFMDIGLPGIDGGHATILIREKEVQEGRKRVPIIALTAHSDKDLCLLAGMDDYLQKPPLLADLKDTIEKWIGTDRGS